MPVRIHLLLLVIALVLGYRWLHAYNTLPQTSSTAILQLFVTISCWFAGGILALSLLTSLVPWIAFIVYKKKKRASLALRTAARQDILNNQVVDVSLAPVIRPPGGYIRLRLLYDGGHLSPKFSLIRARSGGPVFTTRLEGIYRWPVPHIKEYDVQSALVYFEDFFQFFSFTASLPAVNKFYTYPARVAVEQVAAVPRTTVDTTERIDEIRKVEGELLSYKNFEDNDDVRRIVWKIYAKNRDLVVRVPEVNDPYASHIYFYASFYDAISHEAYRGFNTWFLDRYKTVVWNLFEQLYRQNERISYIPDQPVNTFFADDPASRVRYTISTASWQRERDLADYFNDRTGSVLCISSLSDANQVGEIVSKAGRTLTVVLVRLGRSFAGNRVSDWIRWIFIKSPRRAGERLQMAFNLSPLKIKMTNNENALRTLLERSAVAYLVVSPEDLK